MQKYASVGSQRGNGYHSSAKHSPLSEEEQITISELRQQNSRLKKMLKEAQSKRTMMTKECSQLQKVLSQLKGENGELRQRVEQGQQRCDGEKYRWEELKFLNGQLSSQLEALRSDNDSLAEKLRYSQQVLQRKYDELQGKTHRRMEQCAKRIKKTMHYLETLSAKEIDKTKEIMAENLRKAVELLRGRYFEEMNCEGQIEELMNPLKTMQQEISAKNKMASGLKQQNLRLLEELSKYKTMQKQQIPMFKQAIDRLKKNLVQVRGQLSQNEYEKMQLKKKWEQKAKEWEYKYNEAFKESRKLKLEKKIYQNKLQELEAQVEEERERLTAQNHMLKRLYAQQDPASSRVSSASGAGWGDRRVTQKTQQKPQHMLKKNLSGKQLSTRLRASHESDYQIGGEQQSSQVVLGGGGGVREYVQGSDQYQLEQQQTSMLSQQGLKQQICRIDEEIMQIQKHISQELDVYP